MEVKKNNTNKLLVVVIVLLGLVVIGLGSLLVYLNIDKNKKDNNVSDKENSSEVNSEVENEVTQEDLNAPRNGKKLTVYSYVETYTLVNGNKSSFVNVRTSEPTSNKDKYTAYTVTCRTENCAFYDKALDRDSEGNYVLVGEDNKIILFNYIEDRIVAQFNESDIKSIGFGITGNGLVIEKTNGKHGIYNYKEEKLTIPYEYDNIKMVSYGGFQDTRGYYYDKVLKSSVVVKKGNHEGIIDYTTGKIILDVKYDEVLCYRDNSYSSTSNKEYCKVKKNGKYDVWEYNKDTDTFKNLNYKVDDIYDIENSYAYIKNNSILELVDLNTLQKKKVFENFNSNDTFVFMEIANNNITIIFDKAADTTCVEYYYNINTGNSGVTDQECGGIGKPVLYLYPEKETMITVDFARSNLLTTTYPKFIDKWEVLAKPNGDLYDKNGKYYYGLYWEETLINRATFEEGFYVEKDDAITFLEEKLSYIGLSDRERNEFIMYWLPILEKNGKNLVYFELTDERESVNKINITPQPDSLLRMVIHVKKVDSKVSIKEQKLTKFDRKGFTAVEWGGHNY